MSSLPIEHLLPDLRRTLRRRKEAVIQAPPGAGKTTRVPLALLEEPWLNRGASIEGTSNGGHSRKIVMLEPRRLAARASARRMASMLGERPGQTVGYRVRMDTKVGPATRIEVVTEGVLTRMLQSDPSLEHVGAVIFDEYHERSLHADLGLALTLDARSALRPDLRIIVMSATLDGARVAETVDDAPLLTSEGRTYSVETVYLDRTPERGIESEAAGAIERALADRQGDILAFLPGAGEILRTADILGELGPDVDVYPLFGRMSFREQDAAIEPSPTGRRKVVLATDIAETSLTIEGVRVVVDSGLVRTPSYDPSTGMTRLVTRKIARSSADQRRGRAGRLAPGHCYRLWTELDHAHRRDFTDPEILHADLAPLMLELACWGVDDPDDLTWLDPPPGAATGAALSLLEDLRAIDRSGSVSLHGREMSRLGVHPRLAHMILAGRELGVGSTACAIASLLSERDVLLPSVRKPPADIRMRLQLMGRGSSRQAPYAQGFEVHRGALKRARRLKKEFERKAGISRAQLKPERAGLLLAHAYPDRIAQLREGSVGQYRLRGGQSASLDESDPMAEESFLAVANAGGTGVVARIYLAAPIQSHDIEDLFADEITEQDYVHFDEDHGRVRADRRRSVGSIVLQQGPLKDTDPDRLADCLLGGIRQEGLEVLPWTKKTRQLQRRLEFMHTRDEEWPDASMCGLERRLSVWLRPFIRGMRSLDDLRRMDLSEALMIGLDWNRRQELEERAPTHLTVPSGSNIPIDYSDPDAPALAVRLQEVFGLLQTPTIDRGSVRLTMKLLSPAQRPVQITKDLKSFWAEGYFDVRKEMRGRYPKHHWPEDPLTATPTARVRPSK